MRRGAKPTKSKVVTKPPIARTSRKKSESSRVHDLEKRLAEALARERATGEILQAKDRALTEALKQQTATGEILRVINRSPSDVQPVFDAILSSAIRLMGAFSGTLTRIAGDFIELAAFKSTDDGGEATRRAAFPQPLQSEGVHTRAIRGRAPVNIAEAQTDPHVREIGRSIARAVGYQSMVAVPMLRHDVPIGTIAATRREPGGFTDDEIALLQTFAAQAVIAIENVRLFNETKEALERQTATAEVLQVISASPTGLEPVFSAILERAVSLCDAVFGVIYRFDGELIHIVAHHNYTSEALGVLQARYPSPPGPRNMTSRAILERTVVQAEDACDESLFPAGSVAVARQLGYRGIISVPMLREGMPLGTITLAKRERGLFADKQVALLKTFADQAVIAIENVRLFKELELANRELEAASQHKSEFLANMSHELRTPLNSIIGFSEVLTERMFGELNEKQEEYLKDIHASGQHLLSLINDILDLSKIEAGRMELELSDFDLPTAIDNALTLVRERAGRRSITLHTAVDARLGQVRADERKVRQVVLNLLSNAIKFTPEGGRIEVAAVPRDGSVEVSVSDTGVGIAPEDQETVFEEFRQVGTADKKVEGTGLGLTLCRKFVELHGGRIRVKSELGVGSTFTFTLPVPHGE